MDIRTVFLCRTVGRIFILILVIHTQTSSGKPSSALNRNRKHQNTYHQSQLGKIKSLYGTPVWNTYNIPLQENSRYGYGPHEVQTDHSHNGEHKPQGLTNVLNEFIAVMGPFLFPLPYFLAMLPFAIPAIPLALWIDRTNGEGESHHPAESSPSHTPPSGTNSTEHSTEHPTIPTTPTPTTMQTQKPMTTTTKRLPTTRPTTRTPTRPTTTTTTTDNPHTIISTNFTMTTNHTNTTTSEVFPDTPPLFPFPLFLNSSWLSADYNNGDEYWVHRSQ